MWVRLTCCHWPHGRDPVRFTRTADGGSRHWKARDCGALGKDAYQSRLAVVVRREPLLRLGRWLRRLFSLILLIVSSAESARQLVWGRCDDLWMGSFWSVASAAEVAVGVAVRLGSTVVELASVGGWSQVGMSCGWLRVVACNPQAARSLLENLEFRGNLDFSWIQSLLDGVRWRTGLIGCVEDRTGPGLDRSKLPSPRCGAGEAGSEKSTRAYPVRHLWQLPVSNWKLSSDDTTTKPVQTKNTKSFQIGIQHVKPIVYSFQD